MISQRVPDDARGKDPTDRSRSRGSTDLNALACTTTAATSLAHAPLRDLRALLKVRACERRAALRLERQRLGGGSRKQRNRAVIGPTEMPTAPPGAIPTKKHGSSHSSTSVTQTALVTSLALEATERPEQELVQQTKRIFTGLLETEELTVAPVENALPRVERDGNFQPPISIAAAAAPNTTNDEFINAMATAPLQRGNKLKSSLFGKTISSHSPTSFLPTMPKTRTGAYDTSPADDVKPPTDADGAAATAATATTRASNTQARATNVLEVDATSTNSGDTASAASVTRHSKSNKAKTSSNRSRSTSPGSLRRAEQQILGQYTPSATPRTAVAARPEAPTTITGHHLGRCPP